MLHVTYSRSTTGQTIFHVRVSVGWIEQGEAGNEIGSQAEKKQ